MIVLPELKYTTEHEWVRIEGRKAYIGITDYAQHSLGDVVFVELPEKGATINVGSAFSVVESVKAASDIYAPVSGVVLETNEELVNAPELINQKPYESWIIIAELSEKPNIGRLLNATEYEQLCNKEN